MAYGVHLGQVCLVHWSFIYETTAAEYFYIVAEAFQQGIVHAARHVIVVPHAAVAPDDFREGIPEPLREALRQGCELNYMHEVTELAGAVAQPFRAEGELGVARFDVVPYLFEGIRLVAAGKNILHGIFAAEVPVGEFLSHSELVVKHSVGTVFHCPVSPLNELIAPLALAHVCDNEGA